MDRYIKVADRHNITAKKKLQVQIKMCDNNRDTFIASLHTVFLETDLRDRLFSIIMLMNSLHSCLTRMYCIHYHNN